MNKRKIPNLYITLKEGTDFNMVKENPQVQQVIYKNVVEGIEDAIKTNKAEATVVELNSTGNYIMLGKLSWEKSLERAQTYFLNLEEYETCATIQKLIESINSYGTQRLHRKTSRSNKSNNRNSKYSKTSKKDE